MARGDQVLFESASDEELRSYIADVIQPLVGLALQRNLFDAHFLALARRSGFDAPEKLVRTSSRQRLIRRRQAAS